MKRKRPTYTEGFKADAVKRIKENKESISAVAKDLGINRLTLTNWTNGKKAKKKTAKVTVAKAAKKKTDLVSLVAKKEKLEADLVIIRNKILSEVGISPA